MTLLDDIILWSGLHQQKSPFTVRSLDFNERLYKQIFLARTDELYIVRPQTFKNKSCCVVIKYVGVSSRTCVCHILGVSVWGSRLHGTVHRVHGGRQPVLTKRDRERKRERGSI